MSNLDLDRLSARELLRLHGGIGTELRRRGLVRTGNNLCADIAETLVSRALNWPLETNSKAGFDALDGDQRIEIKSCRIARPDSSRQTSAIRRIDNGPFDRLLGIVFRADYSILIALDVPIAVVRARSTHTAHTNSAIFHLRDGLLGEPGVRNVTNEISACADLILADL